ncbi:MAG: right-handed parallel beta-helix repeat-containing protein, partial [Thermoanaerobaculia bacterium]
ATVLADMLGRYSTVYLRKAFSVADPAATGELELVVDYDDGFIAFLNGREVARSNAGPAGVYPRINALATDSREAGSPEVFRIGDGGSFLLTGVNVLAVVGLNRSTDSGDFSLHPSLRSADPAGEGCPGDFYVAGSQATLAGKALAPGTAAVRVNGQQAAFDRGTGDWSYRAPVPPAGASFTAEALDAAGATLALRTLRAIRVRTLGGDLEDGMTLTPAGGPYVVIGPAAVRAGRRLVIEAGCELFFLAAAGLRIEGHVEARGTSPAPIRFTRLPCGANWGGFEFAASRGKNRFEFCEWSHANGDPGCLTLDDSDLELESCIIRDIDGEGVHSTGSTTRIRRCLTERTREALSLDRGDTVVEFCVIRDAVGKSDLIDCNGSIDPPPRLAFNHIYGTTDDGIDADGSSVIAEGNVIHDCGDQAFSLVGQGASRVSRNLCYRNGNGLSVKDSHLCFAEFNTFALNTVTGVRAIERTAGRGAGIITLRSSIVWGNATPLLVEASGSIDAAYCDVEGGVVSGEGNLSLDPLFADPVQGAFNLKAGSPCIGAAEDGSDLGALPYESAPRAPSDLQAAVQGYEAVWLSWRDNSAVEEAFELERAAAGGEFTPAASLPPGALEFTDRGLAPGTTYRYRLRAVNDLGASAWSDVASAVTEPLPPPVVLGIEPSSGPSRGGTAVTIRGRNLDRRVTSRLGGAVLAEVETLSPEELRGLTPPGMRGPADLLVTTPGGEAVLPAAFSYFDAYRRGDSNGDEVRDITDVLAILGFLFRSGAAPPCLDAADANGDAGVDLADAVYLLFHLFASGRAPAPDEARCFQ